MMRRILVSVISLTCMALGLWNFYNALFPVLPFCGFFLIRLFLLVVAIVVFYAGWTMFGLNEFGRKLVVILLSIGVVINTSALVQSLYYLRKGAIVYDLAAAIYRIRNPYAYQGFLLICIVIALMTITFLLQKETKEIFASSVRPEVEPDIILNKFRSL